MTMKIRASILGAGVHLELLTCARGTGIRGAIASLWRDQSNSLNAVKSSYVAGNTSTGELDELLKRGIIALDLNLPAIRGYEFEIVLGASNSYTGIMSIDHNGLRKPGNDTVRNFAFAWIAQHWAINPSDYIVRVIPGAFPGTYLITCVNRSMFDQLEQFCEYTELRFTKCLPALVEIVLRTPDAGMPTTSGDSTCNPYLEMMLESAASTRKAIVQCVLMRNGQAVTILRFWPGSADRDELQAIGRRIAAQYVAASALPLRIRDWPAIPVGAHPA